MSDKIIQLKDAELQPFLDEHHNELIMVEFYATWCGYCQMTTPVLEELARKYHDQLTVVGVDFDLSPHSVEQYQVDTIPTIFMIKDGKHLARESGFLGKEGFEKMITDHLPKKS